MTGLALWPFFEQWASGDKSFHHINDRPRNAPVRTAIGVAGICLYGILWAEGANDVIADKLQIPLYTITWIVRVAIFVVPIGAYFLAKRICLGLQRKDAGIVAHGWESGVLRQLPGGAFVENRIPASEEELAILQAKEIPAALPVPGEPDANGVPASPSPGIKGWARGVANRAFLETAAAEAGPGDAADGHQETHEEVDGGVHPAVRSTPGFSDSDTAPGESTQADRT